MTRTLLAAVTALALSALSHAGIGAGTYVSRNDLASSTFEDDADPASGFGTYQSAVQGTTASMNWQPGAVSISGTCSGSSTLIARSQGIAILQVAQATNASFTFAMGQTVRAGNQIGWAVVDSGGDPVVGVSYDGNTCVVTGGAPATSSGSAAIVLQPGTYFLVMLAECTTTGGLFNLGATLTAIPTGPTLQTCARPVVAVGDEFTADVRIAGMTADAVGVQARVLYDPSALQFVAFEPGTDFPAALYVTTTAGAVSFATGVEAGSGGGIRAGQVARIRFRAIAPRCADATPIALATTGFPTRITQFGGQALGFTPTDDISVTALVPFAISGIPAAVAGIPADAGVRSAAVGAFAGASVTAQDSCGHPLGTAVSVAMPGGATATEVPAAFPVGTSTVTWTATDAAGHVATEVRTVQVDDRQVLRVGATLGGVVTGNSTRTLSVGYAGASGGQSIATSFTHGSGTATAWVSPAVAGTPTCVSAKDVLHTLRGTAAPAIVGTEYVAAPTLIQGDSNDDNNVDILDFGAFVGDAASGGATPSSRSNFNADGVVNTADFTFISASFLATGSSCDPAWSGTAPRSRISVRELRRLGRGDLAVADLTGDGWVGEEDIAAWLRGARPAVQTRDAGESAIGASDNQ